MKKFFILLFSILLITGCTNEDLADTKTYTTLYPIEYATKYVYGSFSNVTSVYPSGANIDTYELTEKQKDIYSKGDTFIYAGTPKEVNLTVDLLNANPKLKIIYATKGVNFTNSVEELWLDPSNYLKIARNIASTLKDFETNIYSKDKIEKKYEDLKIKLSEITVELTMMGKNASRNTLLVTDEAFNYLTKYGINIISLDPKNNNTTKSYNDARKSIQAGNIKYIYTIKGKEISQEIQTFIVNYKLEKIEIDPMNTLSEEQRKNNADYLTIMTENINKFKTELFR